MPAPVDPVGALDPLEPGIPSGEVVPIPVVPPWNVPIPSGEVAAIGGVPDTLCAAAAPQLRKNAAVIAVKRRIETSLYCALHSGQSHWPHLLEAKARI
jgi:hypothetical protein